MTEVHINYNTSKLQTVINTVKEYNDAPIENRGDNRDVANLLVGSGLLLAVEGDPESEDPETDDVTNYILTVVPEWCRDDHFLDGSDLKDIKEEFASYYSLIEEQRPSDMWRSKLQIVVMVEEWGTMTDRFLSLPEFGDEIAGYISAEFGNE